MRKGNFSPNHIAGIPKTYDQGKIIEDLTREHGISRTRFLIWRKRYHGIEASELKCIKQLEEENMKLKRMYADLAIVLETATTSSKKSFKAL